MLKENIKNYDLDDLKTKLEELEKKNIEQNRFLTGYIEKKLRVLMK